MENKENYLRKFLVAGVGAAELSYEKLGGLIDECVKRGEVTVEKGRALNEELKHRRSEQAAEKKAEPDLSALSADERAQLLEKLLAMQEAGE